MIFFSIEGYILSKLLRCKYLCSIPAFIGEKFNTTIEINQRIHDICKNYNISIEKNVSHIVSDYYYYPFENDGYKNVIIWNYQIIHNNIFNYQYVGCSKNIIHKTNIVKEKSDTNYIIYISFGTVIPNSLYNNNNDICKDFIITIYEKTINTCISFLNKIKHIQTKNKQIYVSCSDIIAEKIKIIKSNIDITIKNNLNQYELLEKCNIFITHGGGNSFQEGLTHKVPMFCIPFFGDQFDVAHCISKYKFGNNIYEESNLFENINKIKDIDNISNINYRMKYIDKFEDKFNEFVDNIDYYYKKTDCIDNINHIQKYILGLIIKKMYTLNFVNIFKDGDLIYGTTKDRIFFTEKYINCKLFKIAEKNSKGEYLTFGELNLSYKNPVIIDQYNDLLKKYTNDELRNFKFDFDIDSYKKYICDKLNYNYDNILNYENEKLLDMCCIGLEYFLKKNRTIYFILKDYNSDKNIGTYKETKYLFELLRLNNQYKSNVKFFKYNDYIDGFEIFDIDNILLDMKFDIVKHINIYDKMVMHMNHILDRFDKKYATLYVNNNPTTFTAIIADGSVSYGIISTGNVTLNELDLVTIKITFANGALNNGACITLLVN